MYVLKAKYTTKVRRGKSSNFTSGEQAEIFPIVLPKDCRSVHGKALRNLLLMGCTHYSLEDIRCKSEITGKPNQFMYTLYMGWVEKDGAK